MADSQDDLDFAKAFKDLAHGENTALALENHLSKLEQKIDELLASVEAQAHDDSQPSENGNSHEGQLPAGQDHEAADSSKSASK